MLVIGRRTKTHGVVRAIFCLSKRVLSVTYDHRIRSPLIQLPVAELERNLIVQRLRAGLRIARLKGETLGRPRVVVDATRIATLRAQGRSWREVCQQMGLSRGTAQKACPRFSGSHRNPCTKSDGSQPSVGLKPLDQLTVSAAFVAKSWR